MQDLSSFESFQEELSELERALVINERKRQRLEQKGAAPQGARDVLPVTERLSQLSQTVDYLTLARDVSVWASAASAKKQQHPLASDLSTEVDQCLSLGNLLCRHSPTSTSDSTLSSSLYDRFYNSLWEEEYQKLHRYLRAKILSLLRQSLRSSGYPSPEGCQELLNQCQQYDATSEDNSTDMFPAYCAWLNQLHAGHQQLLAHMDPTGNDLDQSGRSEIVLELCRPLLDRLRFHFVDESDRITSSRIDRLPEWLFNYIREHVFESGGPWELVLHGLAPVLTALDNATSTGHAQLLPMEFWKEIIGLAKWVLLERNFFRHDLVAGPNSVPLTLCHAIEQVLSFDAHTMDLLPSLHREDADGLADFFIASDEDLWQWWLERERGSVLSTLFDTPIIAEESPSSPRRTDLLLSPRSELFCALIHSIQCKAQVFSSTASSAYLGQVAVPLCMQFLDAIHASATDLKSLLIRGRGIPLDLRKNAQSWMEVINGTHLASEVLTATRNNGLPQSEDLGVTNTDNDLARVGRSLERLRDVLVDEFGTSLVETVLMERAKWASYLMRCPHLLSLADPTDAVSDETSLSPDLHDVASVLSKVVEVCDQHIVAVYERDDDATPDKTQAVLGFAPQAIRSSVANRVADKFLEIALDAHGMTPDIVLGGAKVFARDVALIGDVFGGHNAAFVRLLDVAKFMTMPSEWLSSLRQALMGLVQYGEQPVDQQRTLLKIQQFSVDDTLFEEAMSMIRAKGFAWLELEDAMSILNRRTDSFL